MRNILHVRLQLQKGWNELNKEYCGKVHRNKYIVSELALAVVDVLKRESVLMSICTVLLHIFTQR